MGSSNKVTLQILNEEKYSLAEILLQKNIHELHILFVLLLHRIYKLEV